MKKLLSILAITIGISTFSTTVISCGSSTKTDIKTTIENKINDSNGDIVKGDNLSLDASDNLTQTTILNTIGLTDNEREYVKISSGTLEENVDSEITYDIYSYPTATIPYKTITNNIRLEKINESAKNKVENGEWDYSFRGSRNISLLNQKQLIFSGIDNYSKLSNIDLDFSDNYELKDGGSFSTHKDYAFNDFIYGMSGSSGDKMIYRKVSNIDENGNYTYNSFKVIEDITGVKRLNSSNGIMYALSLDTSSKIWDISDPTNSKIIVSTEENESFSDDVTNFNDVWNLNGTLYVGTNAGLYKSNDDATFDIIDDTNGLNIKSILTTSGGSKMFLNTDAGLYVSTNKKDFIPIPDTSDKTINPNSLFIDNNDVLYYGIENSGLWSIDLSQENLIPNQVTINDSTNITDTSNVKSIVQYYDNTLILLTDENLVYLAD